MVSRTEVDKHFSPGANYALRHEIRGHILNSQQPYPAVMRSRSKVPSRAAAQTCSQGAARPSSATLGSSPRRPQEEPPFSCAANGAQSWSVLATRRNPRESENRTDQRNNNRPLILQAAGGKAGKQPAATSRAQRGLNEVAYRRRPLVSRWHRPMGLGLVRGNLNRVQLRLQPQGSRPLSLAVRSNRFGATSRW